MKELFWQGVGEEKKVKGREEEARSLNAGWRLKNGSVRGMYQKKPEAHPNPKSNTEGTTSQSPRGSKCEFPLNCLKPTCSACRNSRHELAIKFIHPLANENKEE